MDGTKQKISTRQAGVRSSTPRAASARQDISEVDTCDSSVDITESTVIVDAAEAAEKLSRRRVALNDASPHYPPEHCSRCCPQHASEHGADAPRPQAETARSGRWERQRWRRGGTGTGGTAPAGIHQTSRWRRPWTPHRSSPCTPEAAAPSRGGREDDADLPEAEEDLDLGCQAHTDVVDDSAVGKAERRADAGLLPPISHAVAKRCEAARDAEGEGDGDDVARSGADGEALVARVTAGELVMLAAQSWHSGP